MPMVQMTIEMPEGALASLRKDPESFARELRLAAAIKWYELGDVSQGRAAEIAGLSRQEFLTALGRYRVSPFQYTPEEVLEEAGRG
jgi:predicted HTH domain antitoxin